ncbi:60S ribosomal export protein [Planoprotostelium fungivorum]|uniref:60S ribosomal export protein NMD3 n=1 Tax=Planoprotostelium fungivorum TaxID=1890364 RepID=A0A2P6NDV5_9EUKA|nr:60S ribosomal export protein [Planoprotostelium fungivorum]
MEFQSTPATILCCMCGTTIQANPSNMCVNCLRAQVDITDGLPKNLTVQFCKGCDRYLNPPTQWISCDLESKELLSLCLKRVKGLNKVRLIDAGFIWTEPHSRRIKVKLTIQKEVFHSTILQQTFQIEYVVAAQQCEACQRKDAKDTWQAVVQARQRVDHKRTFFYLEQVILKHNAHQNTLNIKEKPDGIDFFFSHRNHAAKMVSFLQAVAPLRSSQSEKLISADQKNNTANVKSTYMVEIVPICRDDIVCLPAKTAQSFGNIIPLLLCVKVSSMIYLMDPFTLQTAELQGPVFWQNPFRAIASSKQMIPFMVLDVTLLGPQNGRYSLADVQIARSSDFGKNDNVLYSRTHLGNILHPGDTVLGYDLGNSNYNDDDVSAMKGRTVPEVVLVRKTYPERRKKNRVRHWRLNNMNMESDDGMKQAEINKALIDYNKFLEELEEDPTLRANVNIFKADGADDIYKRHKQEDEEEMLDDDFPDIGLDELKITDEGSDDDDDEMEGEDMEEEQ